MHGAQAIEPAAVEYFDSVEVSLLTCQPHDEVYSLYGHTALRWHDLHPGGIDAAFNYGVFDYNKPFFVARFVFGLTDYELGAFPYRLFKAEYRHFGSMVTEQVLNLTAQEKAVLQEALRVNLMPGNTVYRYNYFYNNCTTKARDIIEQCINGRVEYAERQMETNTYRETVHRMTQRNPWSRFGNDLLLGLKADWKTTMREQEFLPNNLMADFDRARIVTDGMSRPLVKERRVGVPAGVQMVSESFPLTPAHCAILLAMAGVVILLMEWRKGRTFLWWDITLMTATAAIGIVLTLMLFSQHPTVSVNLLYTLFNPLPLCCLWSVARRRPTRYWKVTLWLGLLFVAAGFVQHFPPEIYALASCLLIQSCMNIRLKAGK